MVKKNKIKPMIFIGTILLIIVGITLAIYFYPAPTAPTPGQGPILNWICSGPVNEAVNAVKTQCDNDVINNCKAENAKFTQTLQKIYDPAPSMITL
jgi:hypothetical protein